MSSMKNLLPLLLAVLPASAQTGFEASVEAGVKAATDRARAATAIKPPKLAPREIKDGVIPRLQRKTFPLPADGKCGLKDFSVVDYEARESVKGDEASRLTVAGAVIETTSPECLRDYGVVQFIRGCVYHARYSLPSGAEIEKVFDVARHLRGPRVVFSHPGWEVDRTELDPVYMSYPDEESRVDLYYTPRGPLRLRPDAASLMADYKYFNDPAQRRFLKDTEAPASAFFVGDVPEGGVSTVNEERTVLSAENSSLEFRTCVYRLQDVPSSGDPAGEGVAPENGGPIQCFGWMSRYTFDPATRDFVTDKFAGVDPFCAQAPARVVLPGS
jgi:hypothetical protein